MIDEIWLLTNDKLSSLTIHESDQYDTHANIIFETNLNIFFNFQPYHYRAVVGVMDSNPLLLHIYFQKVRGLIFPDFKKAVKQLITKSLK